MKRKHGCLRAEVELVFAAYIWFEMTRFLHSVTSTTDGLLRKDCKLQVYFLFCSMKVTLLTA